MNARGLQITAMATLALFVPAVMAGSREIWISIHIAIFVLVVLYASVLVALFSTIACYRSRQQAPLARWRRKLFITGVAVLTALCLLPLATWPIALSGITLHLRAAILCLFSVNVAAAILVWFGRGWSRLGLTVVAYWVCILWIFPIAIRG